MTKLDMPHSPVREIKTFDPPSLVDNPWENLASWVEEEDGEATKTKGDSHFWCLVTEGSEFVVI
jgi:hypothetical protein